MFDIQSPKTWQAQEKIVTTLEQMQIPNATGPGVRSKRLLLASRTTCNALWKSSEICNNVKICNKVQVGYKFIGVMSYQLRVSLFTVMSQNVM